MSEFPRITIRPDQMGGVPRIRGLRIPVSVVVDMIAEGMTQGEILRNFPDLEAADIPAALKYAAKLAEQSAVMSTEQALTLMDRARAKADLDDDEAMDLAVNEVRAYRAEQRKNGNS